MREVHGILNPQFEKSTRGTRPEKEKKHPMNLKIYLTQQKLTVKLCEISKQVKPNKLNHL